MTLPSRRQVIGLAVGTALRPHRAFADAAYPSHAVHLIVGSSPGSSPDVIARLVAAELAQQLKQPVVVENKPGASTSIGIASVAKAPPDGYLIGYVTPSLVLNPALHAAVAFDGERDLEPVVRLGGQPLVLAVNAATPWHDVHALVDDARRGHLTYASTGAGSIFHLTTARFCAAAGIACVHVPYTSGPQAITELIGGQVDFMFNAVNVLLPHLKSGRLRALGVTSLARSALLPDLATLAEQGIAGIEVVTWGGLVVPSRTPRDVVEALNAAANAALAAPQVRKTLAESGYEIAGGSADGFKAFLRAEKAKWEAIVQASGISLR